MEVTGRFELPEELLDLERSGINEAAAFERSRARRSLSQAPSPPLGNSPAREMLGLDGEASRYTSRTVMRSVLMVQCISGEAWCSSANDAPTGILCIHFTKCGPFAAQYTTANLPRWHNDAEYADVLVVQCISGGTLVQPCKVDPNQRTMCTYDHVWLIAAQYTTANPSCC